MIPLVSVIIATRNYGHYLADAISSVLHQSLQPIELLVIDDGSSDNTDQLLRPYLGDHRVRCYRLCAAGQAEAKNAGLQLATAPLLAYLDADDLWFPNKLTQQYHQFQLDARLGAVGTLRQIMMPDGRIVNKSAPTLVLDDECESLLRVGNRVCFSSVMLRKDIALAAGMFDPQYLLAIDFDLWLRLAVSRRFAIVNDALTLYRTGHSNLSQQVAPRATVALEMVTRFGTRNSPLIPTALTIRAKGRICLHTAQALLPRSRLQCLYWAACALWRQPFCRSAWYILVRVIVPRSLISIARRILPRGVVPT